MVINKHIIKKLKNRDEKVFDQIYQEFEGLVYYICFSMTGNKETSEDLTQETFIKLLNSLDSYEEDGHFKQYLMQIARNLSKNYLMRVQNKEIDYDEEMYENSRVDSLEEVQLIITLRGLLSEVEADIVILKIVYDFKFKEIAEEKHFTIGETQAIYYKALKKVKKAYAEEEL